MTIRIRKSKFRGLGIRFSNAGLTHLPDCPESRGLGIRRGYSPHPNAFVISSYFLMTNLG